MLFRSDMADGCSESKLIIFSSFILGELNDVKSLLVDTTVDLVSSPLPPNSATSHPAARGPEQSRSRVTQIVRLGVNGPFSNTLFTTA